MNLLVESFHLLNQHSVHTLLIFYRVFIQSHFQIKVLWELFGKKLKLIQGDVQIVSHNGSLTKYNTCEVKSPKILNDLQ